jgi:hypothetical protein
MGTLVEPKWSVSPSFGSIAEDVLACASRDELAAFAGEVGAWAHPAKVLHHKVKGMIAMVAMLERRSRWRPL